MNELFGVTLVLNKEKWRREEAELTSTGEL